jgi:hypothetical protein
MVISSGGILEIDLLLLEYPWPDCFHPETPSPLAGEGRGEGGIEMKSLYIPIIITPTLTLPRQRGRGIPGFPDQN